MHLTSTLICLLFVGLGIELPTPTAAQYWRPEPGDPDPAYWKDYEYDDDTESTTDSTTGLSTDESTDSSTGLSKELTTAFETISSTDSSTYSSTDLNTESSTDYSWTSSTDSNPHFPQTIANDWKTYLCWFFVILLSGIIVVLVKFMVRRKTSYSVKDQCGAPELGTVQFKK
ncbi:clumping factor B-like [Drosophila rhopaloa]|uniref:Uncharacterized protein n=1 Tax=Drosophila rhopaloa TaxID=1041015 RepID=A0ABM5I3T1_DRORH|nr:clumping factor B-like [Drosophila rhopaloa]